MAAQGSEGVLSPFLKRRRFKAARPYIKGRVLDIGCGAGELAAYINPGFYLGVEQDEESLRKAKNDFPRHRFLPALPDENETFDTVVALAVIEHVPYPAGFLQNVASYLNDTARSWIVLTTPHPSVDWIHGIGSAIGLFSHHAYEEHEVLLNKQKLHAIAEAAGLSMVVYKRFLLGANQLAVFRPLPSPGNDRIAVEKEN